MSTLSEQVFTEPAPKEQLSPDAFIARHRLPNPFLVTRKRSGSRSIEVRRKQAMFLHAFAHTGLDLVGCKAARISRSTLIRWRSDDVAFANLYELAARDAYERAEEELQRRALDGWDETTTITDGGKRYTKTVRRYDSNLLALLVKSRNAKYRETKAQTINATQNNVNVVPIDRLTDEEFALLGRIMGKAGPALEAPQPRRLGR